MYNNHVGDFVGFRILENIQLCSLKTHHPNIQEITEHRLAEAILPGKFGINCFSWIVVGPMAVGHATVRKM